MQGKSQSGKYLVQRGSLDALIDFSREAFLGVEIQQREQLLQGLSYLPYLRNLFFCEVTIEKEEGAEG